MFRKINIAVSTVLSLLLFVTISEANAQRALDPNLISQDEIKNGNKTLKEIRDAGKVVFTTPFLHEDGVGDGHVIPGTDNTSIGKRPGLQTPNTSFLRVNGLDGQTCLECHSILSRDEIPMTFAIGGHGGINNNPIFQPTTIDINNLQSNEFAFTDGRFINPPFLYGTGGVELLSQEITKNLQNIREKAGTLPIGTTLKLESHGISFGTITSNGNGTVTLNIDSGGYAIDEDLVVRPFGRKGEFFSIRDFDVGAMKFHFGIEPVENVGENVDGDGDGVVNEVGVGHLSALSIFISSMPRPIEEYSKHLHDGFEIFKEIGCSSCHIPETQSESKILSFNYPEIPTEWDNSTYVYMEMDMSKKPMKFDTTSNGIAVRMFSDLKRHNMGTELAESTGNVLDPYFVTAKLWGVADSAPYLHDGRALTIPEAILSHGGEAEQEKIKYKNLNDNDKEKLLHFLKSLRVPKIEDIEAVTK